MRRLDTFTEGVIVRTGRTKSVVWGLAVGLMLSAIGACFTYYSIDREGPNIYLAGRTDYLFSVTKWVKKCVERPLEDGGMGLKCATMPVQDVERVLTAEALRDQLVVLSFEACLKPLRGKVSEVEVNVTMEVNPDGSVNAVSVLPLASDTSGAVPASCLEGVIRKTSFEPFMGSATGHNLRLALPVRAKPRSARYKNHSSAQ